MKALIFLLLALPAFAVPMPAVDLSSIPVTNRASPLTNARVLSVTVRGVTFACDQGIVQVPFESLPPEFAEYRAKAKPDTTPAVKMTKPALTVPPKTTTTKPATVKTPLQLAREAKERAQKIDHYKTMIAQSEALIDRYDKQTLIGNPNPVSTEDYNLAKALLEDSKVKLTELTQ